MAHLQVEIVAPDRRVFQGDARGVQAPGRLGSFEVLLNHAPMIAAFDIGAVRITSAHGEQVFFASSGGFLEVIDNRVTVLADTAEPVSEIDTQRAKAAEERALQRLQSTGEDIDRARASRALERARNRLRMAMGRIGKTAAG